MHEFVEIDTQMLNIGNHVSYSNVVSKWKLTCTPQIDPGRYVHNANCSFNFVNILSPFAPCSGCGNLKIRVRYVNHKRLLLNEWHHFHTCKACLIKPNVMLCLSRNLWPSSYDFFHMKWKADIKLLLHKVR